MQFWSELQINNIKTCVIMISANMLSDFQYFGFLKFRIKKRFFLTGTKKWEIKKHYRNKD